MRIGFDVQPLMDSQKTGIGFYQANMISALAELYPENTFILNCFVYRNRPEKLKRLEVFTRKGIVLNECRWFPERIYRFLWNFIPVPYGLFFGKKSEITQFFNYHIPPGVRGKTITAIHDMAYRVYPETVRLKTKMMLRLSLPRSCKRADRIITISEFSKSEIIKYMGVPAERITVVPCGVDTDFYKPADCETIATVREKYELPKSYLLYLGTLEPRKNIERLIDAYARLIGDRPDAPHLVIAGRKGWLYDTIFERVQRHGLAHNVLFTGYVAQQDAPALYSGALAFVFPSLYEGFGMPPLEAMACGVPVLTSNVASLPEVAGDAAILVDPYSVEDIYKGMKRLVEDDGLRRQLSLRGYERVRLYTWRHSAERMMQLYEELTESGK